MKTISEVLHERKEIVSLARERLLPTEKNPTSEVLMGLVLYNGSQLSKIRAKTEQLLGSFPRSSFPSLRTNIKRIRVIAQEADTNRTYGRRKDFLKQDLQTIIDAMVAIETAGSVDIADEMPPTQEAIKENDTLQLSGINDGWPKPAYHVDNEGLFTLSCRVLHKWGLYLYLEQEDHDPSFTNPEGVLNAAPYLNNRSLTGSGWKEQYLFFDNKLDMERCYWATVGRDGPTDTNPFDGTATVYALTCSPTGQLLNENT